LMGRTIVDESKGVKDFRVVFTRMEKTGRCDPHVHEHAEQLFIVLKGTMMFKNDQGEMPVREGQAVLVKRGEIHSNYNIAEGETEYITVTGTPKI
jgi:mannose-6-phosphate isomerase-like protein (cupin superfamily)